MHQRKECKPQNTGFYHLIISFFSRTEYTAAKTAKQGVPAAVCSNYRLLCDFYFKDNASQRFQSVTDALVVHFAQLALRGGVEKVQQGVQQRWYSFSAPLPDKQGNNRCGFIVGVGLTVSKLPAAAPKGLPTGVPRLNGQSGLDVQNAL
jgi:hypothetical protein